MNPAAKTSTTETRTLAPGEIYPIPAPGDFFLVTETTGTVEIYRTGAPFLPYSQGDSETLPPGTEFDRLEVRNPNPYPVTVSVFVGYGRRNQSRQSTLETPTTATGTGLITLAAGESITLNGMPPEGCIYRKAVLVTNFDLANALVIETAAGVAIGACLPRTAWRENLSCSLRITNTSGGGVPCIVGEVWHSLR